MSKARDLGNLLDTGGDVVSGSLDNVSIDNSKISGMDASKLTGTVADARVSTLTASKLTGALPAISGASLTGIVAGPTISANDPAINTNPSGGVGTQWANSTSGEMFICTDATTDENVWTNVGAGTGDIQSFVGNGSTYGYTHGGTGSNVIDRFPFASDANSTDVGDCTITSNPEGSGASSGTYGYVAGGGAPYSNRIEKVQQVATANATNVGNLTVTVGNKSGSMSPTHGYTAGGYPITNVIEKWPFASDTNSSDVGDLTIGRQVMGGNTSSDYGYTHGGRGPGSTNHNVIERYSFSSDGNATDVGDITRLAWGGRGNVQSETYGWTMGGGGSWHSNVIDRYQFAASSNATDWGDLSASQGSGDGHSSQTNGYYTGGGMSNGYTVGSACEKWTLSSAGNSTDVFDLSVNRRMVQGTHI
jgi:hypothetical protein